MYLIVSVDCIGFDHTLFYYFIFSYSAIFAASMSINVQYSVFSTYLVTLYRARTMTTLSSHLYVRKKPKNSWQNPAKQRSCSETASDRIKDIINYNVVLRRICLSCFVVGPLLSRLNTAALHWSRSLTFTLHCRRARDTSIFHSSVG